MKKWKWYGLICIIALIFFFAGFGVKDQIEEAKEVGIQPQSNETLEILMMINDLLFIPDSLPDDVSFAGFTMSLEPGNESFESNFASTDGTKAIKLGVSDLDLHGNTIISEYYNHKINFTTYKNEDTGDHILVYKTEFTNFYVESKLSPDLLQEIMIEYVQYLLDKRISE